jgi:hypothetical protein
MDDAWSQAELEAPLDELTETAISRAVGEARDPYDHEIAVAAEYEPRYDLLILGLKTGQRLAIPREDLQGLAGADEKLVGKVEIGPFGLSLRWEQLDVDFLVDALRRGIYGSARWMRELEQRRSVGSGALLSQTA